MKILISFSLFIMILLSGCVEEKKEQSANTQTQQVEQKQESSLKNETIQKTADELKDKTSDVIDTAAKMAEELSSESKVIAKDVKEESRKVITKIAKQTKEITDVAVEKINEAKQSLDITIDQVIEDEKSKEPEFLGNESSSNEEGTTETEEPALTTEEDTQAQELYLKCAGCHGQKAERAALNRSEIIQDWDAQKIYDALKGYQSGTYGSIMKGMMQGQVSHLSDEELLILSEYITTLK